MDFIIIIILSVYNGLWIYKAQDLCFIAVATAKSSTECLISHKLTFYFGVIHSFVFCAFDSQFNTIAR